MTTTTTVKKSKLEGELLTALKIKRKTDEKPQSLFKRIAEAADELDDEEFSALDLSEAAQVWLNDAAKAVKKEEDIPGFDNGAGTDDKPAKRKVKAKAVEEDEDEDEDEEDEEDKPARKSKAKAKKVVEEDEDDEEEDDEEEDEKPVKRTAKKKAEPKRKSDDDEDEEDEEKEDDEDEEEERPRAAKSRKAVAKKRSRSDDDEDEDEDEEDEDEKPAKRAKARKAKDADEDEDEEDEDKKSKRAKIRKQFRRATWRVPFKKLVIKNPKLSVEKLLAKLNSDQDISIVWATTMRRETLATVNLLKDMGLLAD
jgi:hypothetical protein